MSKIFKYDLFISYASHNGDIANFIVEKLEKRGKKCFIAPRDIIGGSDYACEIVHAISNSCATLLIFSEESDKSAYVLREINSAVSRNKTIIPLRIEDFLPSEAMEFYLGPTQWLNAYPKVLDIHLDSIINIIDTIENLDTSNNSKYQIKGPEVFDNNQLFSLGYTKEKITMREIELDYLCVDQEKYVMNDEIEGTMEDWSSVTKEFADAGCALIINDQIVGYSYILPLVDEEYEKVISGEVMINSDMIDIYSLGGEYNAYISMLALDPEYSNQENYKLIIKRILEKIRNWKKENIIINKIGISVYTNLLKKFLIKLGFKKVGVNPANGEILECYVNVLESHDF